MPVHLRFASALDEKPRNWTERTILQGDDANWHGSHRHLDRQGLYLRAPRGKSQNCFRKDREKAPGGRETYPHLQVQRWPTSLAETAMPRSTPGRSKVDKSERTARHAAEDTMVAAASRRSAHCAEHFMHLERHHAEIRRQCQIKAAVLKLGLQWNTIIGKVFGCLGVVLPRLDQLRERHDCDDRKDRTGTIEQHGEHHRGADQPDAR